MAQMLSGSICISDIPKDKITTRKNGKLYLPVSVFVSNDYKFGNNAGISINQTKEQREAGQKKIYIGNAKTVWADGTQASPENSAPAESASVPDDLPF